MLFRSVAYADFSSSSVLVKPALATGNIDIYPNAMAREVLTDSEGKATGVSYINKEDLLEYQVTGKVIVLAASACESSRLLLNSKSARHPKRSKGPLPSPTPSPASSRSAPAVPGAAATGSAGSGRRR